MSVQFWGSTIGRPHTCSYKPHSLKFVLLLIRMEKVVVYCCTGCALHNSREAICTGVMAALWWFWSHLCPDLLPYLFFGSEVGQGTSYWASASFNICFSGIQPPYFSHKRVKMGNRDWSLFDENVLWIIILRNPGDQKLMLAVRSKLIKIKILDNGEIQ